MLNPRTLLFIDGCGALLSAFLLGVLLPRFESLFGMPREALYLLASLPYLFVIYDVICYLSIQTNLAFYLRIIGFANLGYCLISMVFVLHHCQELTNLGLIYFMLELAIVIFLTGIELNTAAKLEGD